MAFFYVLQKKNVIYFCFCEGVDLLLLYSMIKGYMKKHLTVGKIQKEKFRLQSPLNNVSQ